MLQLEQERNRRLADPSQNASIYVTEGSQGLLCGKRLFA